MQLLKAKRLLKKFVLLTYGLPDFARQNASELVQAKWNIQFYFVAGCVVTQELADSVKRENENVLKLIEAAYGSNWKDKFDEEVEEEYKIEVQIDSLVRSQPYLAYKEIRNISPGAPFPMYPADKSGNYIVSISTYDSHWNEKKLYILKVNYKKNFVTILHDYTLKKQKKSA